MILFPSADRGNIQTRFRSIRTARQKKKTAASVRLPEKPNTAARLMRQTSRRTAIEAAEAAVRDRPERSSPYASMPL